MRRFWGWIGALLLFSAAGARADAVPPRPFTKGTQVLIVGQITSQPKDFIIDEDKMQIAVGPERVKHTLHLSHAKLWNYAGQRIKDNDLVDQLWVRAEGTIMNDPRRIQVSTLQVIGRNDQEYRQSAYFLPGLEPGYVQAVAGSREYYASTKPFPTGAHVVLLGEITSQPKDNLVDEDKMQVMVGPKQRKFTLHMDDATVLGFNGKRLNNNELVDKMWVRAEGTVMEDGRRIQVTRVEVVGRNWDQFRSGPYFSSGTERGYAYEVTAPR